MKLSIEINDRDIHEAVEKMVFDEITRVGGELISEKVDKAFPDDAIDCLAAAITGRLRGYDLDFVDGRIIDAIDKRLAMAIEQITDDDFKNILMRRLIDKIGR